MKYSYRHFLVCLIKSLDVHTLFREESSKLHFETYFLIYGDMGLLVHFWTVLQTVLFMKNFCAHKHTTLLIFHLLVSLLCVCDYL